MSVQTIRLGGGHCCMCSGVCSHVGGPWLCSEHRAQASHGHHCPGCACRPAIPLHWPSGAANPPLWQQFTANNTAAAG